MKNSADQGGCYPQRPKAEVDNALLDLQNSSYPTQPHSIIPKYTLTFPANSTECFCIVFGRLCAFLYSRRYGQTAMPLKILLQKRKT